jgi:hypothetical protein
MLKRDYLAWQTYMKTSALLEHVHSVDASVPPRYEDMYPLLAALFAWNRYNRLHLHDRAKLDALLQKDNGYGRKRGVRCAMADIVRKATTTVTEAREEVRRARVAKKAEPAAAATAAAAVQSRKSKLSPAPADVAAAAAATTAEAQPQMTAPAKRPYDRDGIPGAARACRG